MALKKQITMDNGIVLEYHRIAQLRIETNYRIVLCIYSYTNEESRLNELELLENQNELMIELPYKYMWDLILDYDESVNIIDAYEWLKQRPEFEGAEDVLEDEEESESSEEN